MQLLKGPVQIIDSLFNSSEKLVIKFSIISFFPIIFYLSTNFILIEIFVILIKFKLQFGVDCEIIVQDTSNHIREHVLKGKHSNAPPQKASNRI